MRSRASARSRVVEDVLVTPAPDLAMLSVALRELRNLAGAGGVARAPAGVGHRLTRVGRGGRQARRRRFAKIGTRSEASFAG